MRVRRTRDASVGIDLQKHKPKQRLRAVKHHAKKAALTSARATKKVAHHTAKHTKRAYKKTHHHVAHRPHVYLVSRVTWYANWHGKSIHIHVHRAIFGVYLLLVGFLLVTGCQAARAASDLFNAWDFTDDTPYTIDSGIEVNGSSARLKAQNYTSDANTSALYHFDESSGNTANDSSSNNNDATGNNSPSFVAGNLNNAAQFDGLNDRLKAPDSSSLSPNFANTLEAWTKFDEAFDDSSHNQQQTILDKGSYKLYYDHTTGKVAYEMANAGSSTWSQMAGGDDINGGWGTDNKTGASAQATDGTNVFVGLEGAAGAAEVWRWSGSAWTKIGGDGVNGSWPASDNKESVTNLLYAGGVLYASTGSTANDGEVWSYNGTSWTKIGGLGINGGWNTNFEAVASMTYANDTLYVGLGLTNNEAQVYSWNGTTWTNIGGFGVSAPYNAFTTGYDVLQSIHHDGSNLYVGFGSGSGEADVWRLSGTTWTQVGGDSINSSWGAGYERVYSLYSQGGSLYAGLGASAGDGELWRFTAGTWTKIGGDGLNSSWGSEIEGVRSIIGDGTDLYVGLGNTGNDSELWKLSGGAWSKLGGDGVNGGYDYVTGATHSSVLSLVFVGSTLYAGLGDGTGGHLWSVTGTTWTRVGGDAVNDSWGLYDVNRVLSMVSWQGKLYAGLGGLAGTGTVWEYDDGWKIIGGQGNNSSWNFEEIEYVHTLNVHNGQLYAGLGGSPGDAEVWRYDGSSWTKLGGDGVNSSWNGNYDAVGTATSYNGQYCVGLGDSNLESEVWCVNGTTWTQIGGDDIAGGWGSGIEAVKSLITHDNQLYAGLGLSPGDGEVWRYNGTTWTKIGGDGLNSSWADSTYESVTQMTVYNGQIYVGLGNGIADAEIWRYDGTNWSKIAGDSVNGSWPEADNISDVYSLTVYNGELYAGTGANDTKGDLWRYNGSTWTQIGGDSLNLSWTTVVESVRSMTVHNGKLYAGLGDGAADPNIWSYGNNAFLSSTTDSFNTGWNHIAATYDGTNMKLFINGVEDNSVSASNLMPDNSYDLLIGSSYGAPRQNGTAGYFKGQIDEVRISNIARSSFTTQPYLSSRQLITLNDPVRTNGVDQWDAFLADETVNGGSINYRVSADDGDSWLYWDGDSWETSASEAQANTASDINDNFDTFPVTFEGMKWQAVMQGDGFQQVTLNGIEAEATSDLIDPATNATNIVASKTNGGAALASNGWTNSGAPYFTWDAATDANSGIKGYCVYLGTDNSADPVTTKGLLGASPEATGGNCQFITPTNSLDLATPGLLGTALTTSNDPYYISVKAIDNAGNISDTSEQFFFRFDNTPPSNPGFINAPSSFLTEKEVTMTWPTAGGNAAADANSGVAGLQYKIEDTDWYGDSHTGSGDIDDLLANDGSYTTVDPPDFANLVDGVNTVYFRTWDQAGNVTTTYVTAALKINTSGAPSEPLNLQATPTTNTTNAFAFSWDEPEDYIGEANSLTYCYTVNTLPTVNTCTYTSAGVTALGAGPYATQPGENTFYVVARDETNNVSYVNYASATFTANTPSPGIPTNMDAVDVSIRATSNWRLAITWDTPANVGAGISSYKVFRSTDNNTFTQVGTSVGTTYIDTGLTQQRYYYRVQACDNTNNCGANGTVVDEVPTGRFTEPATLVSEPRVSSVTTKKATVNWSTNRESDSRIALGTSSGKYSNSEVAVSDQVTDHEIELDNLSAGTTYYFVAKWTDDDGNTGQSQEFTFTTSPAPTLKEVKTIRVGLSDALVQFTTRQATRASVVYGRTEAFGGTETVNTALSESTYNVELTGLDDGTEYFYKIITYDDEGTAYDSSIFTFTTPARPRISNLRFQPVKGEPTSTQRVTWDTNVAANSRVTYGKVNTEGADVLSSKLVTGHEIIIRGLEDDSEYFLIAESRDAGGNIAVSDRQVFRTALDTRAPKVSDVTVEATVRGTGAEARGQIVVSWKTDEPATSQVAYTEGSNPETFNNQTTEDATLATEHIVIISDLPTSRVYSVQPVSTDDSGNGATGAIKPVIIRRASDNILTSIFNALQRIIGF